MLLRLQTPAGQIRLETSIETLNQDIANLGYTEYTLLVKGEVDLLSLKHGDLVYLQPLSTTNPMDTQPTNHTMDSVDSMLVTVNGSIPRNRSK